MNTSHMLESGCGPKLHKDRGPLQAPLATETKQLQYDRAITYTAKTIYGNHIQEPQEKLIAHQHGTKQIPQDQSARMIPRIRELIKTSENDTRQVKSHDDDEEFPIRVHPQSELNPKANLSLWRCCLD